MGMTISGLTIYPVKSLRGISLKQSRLTPQGLEHDRRFMVVRSNGRFVTQRDRSLLALIETRLTEDGVVLSRDGHGSICLPFAASPGTSMHSKVWNDEVETTDTGDEISAWLTAATESQQALRIVRMATGFIRQGSSAARFGKENATFFADASPYLLANQSSLDALNAELEQRGFDAVPMDRFRPNVVVKGLHAFGEHETSTVSNNLYEFELSEPCERCIVPTIDQCTAIRNPQKEPFNTLVDINPMPGKRTPAFAENARLLRGAGEIIRTGDEVQAKADPSCGN